jgi:hypothetical protein
MDCVASRDMDFDALLRHPTAAAGVPGVRTQESDVDELRDMLRAVYGSTLIPKPIARKFERSLAALRTTTIR